MKDVENEINSDGLVKAIVKRALGYDSKEVVEEYAKGEQGEIVLTKKKVTIKNVPPDVSALKILLELDKSKDVESMTDEEIEAELNAILTALKENDIELKEKTKCKKTQKQAKNKNAN